ncbi:MAG: hypothetical protein HC923_01360 [Myxococcales bacterium]|nr:hypothetical protein [Myxococcales bacterium]
MRIASVSDLHLDHAANRELMPRLAQCIHDGGADLVVIAGDVSHRDEWIEKAVRAFSVAAPAVAFIPGNHDLWETPSPVDTWRRYRVHLRQLVESAGGWYLPAAPWTRGDVAVAGTCGWYDHGFLLPPYRDLMSVERERTKQLGRHQWSDAKFVKFFAEDGRDMSDVEVTTIMIRELSEQLETLQHNPAISKVLVATHHLPFDEVVFRTGTLPWEFFNSFMGSPRIGEAMLRYDKVRDIVYGHTHLGRDVTVSGRRVRGTPLGYPRERGSESAEVTSNTRWDGGPVTASARITPVRFCRSSSCGRANDRRSRCSDR